MASRDITDELVDEAAKLLRERFELDGDDVRELGARLAGARAARSLENTEFAHRFVAEHRTTFDRLAQ